MIEYLTNIKSVIDGLSTWFLNHKLLFIPCCIFIIIVILLDFRNNDLKNKQLYKEYPVLQQYFSSEVVGYITKVIPFKRGSRFFEASNGIKFNIANFSKNYLYKEPNLAYFIQIGDSIYKPANSDTLYIYKDNKKYYFILGKIINKED